MSQQINLFNPALLKQEPVFTAVTMARALGLLLVGVAALGLYGRHSLNETQQQANATAEVLNGRKLRLATAQSQFAPRARNPEFERRILEGEARVLALRDVAGVFQRGDFGNTGGYAAYLAALARQGGGDLWLTGVSITGAGKQIGLRGRALAPELVPAFIGRLTHEPVMQGKSFGSLRIERAEVETRDKDGKVGKPELAPYVDFSLQGEPAVAAVADNATGVRP